MGELIQFPSGPDLLAAKAKANHRVERERALYRLSRFYIKMNTVTGPDMIFTPKGRVVGTALEFVENVCETIGYYEPGDTFKPEETA